MTLEYTLSNQIEWLPNQRWDERIHIAANADLIQVFMVVTARYVVLIDTLLNPTTARALVEQARPYLVSRQLLVINTHADWDHAWGNQYFAGPTARQPAPIIAHDAARTRFHSPDDHATLRKMRRARPDIFSDVVITQPTLTFTSELWLDGGDLTLYLFPTPGHSPDHIAIFIPEIRTLFAGDAAEIPFPIIHRASDLPAVRASLRAMADLYPRAAFYCHAPPDVGPQLLQDNLAYYQALEAACRAALARGFDARTVPDAELPDALNCCFEDVAPTTGAWAEVSPHARTARHGVQLRLMLAWLQHEELALNEE